MPVFSPAPQATPQALGITLQQLLACWGLTVTRAATDWLHVDRAGNFYKPSCTVLIEKADLAAEANAAANAAAIYSATPWTLSQAGESALRTKKECGFSCLFALSQAELQMSPRGLLPTALTGAPFATAPAFPSPQAGHPMGRIH